ncbi:Thiazole tautomerase [Paenibacillus polymyxa E681]|uniref:thiamine phosphate synthase n=1 Tax=Paenibacillus polymyxa TaxID=1406 RepID=UPI0001E31E43|nr:thiamine phosphate synthase [Paenibacillus polymyxa]ADM70372.1 regulatory protein [Paenibacillus polymyxa E681]QNV57400.1 Thiazole tautomerase [Paenibacillus polymyxa E681]QNV62237.1 Thiazole tautomerase [Paenibacillus polymyxa E681]
MEKGTFAQAAQVAAVICPYVHYVHARLKQNGASALLSLTRSMVEQGVPLQQIVVNDRVDVALLTLVGAVQLPANGLPVADVKSLLPKGTRFGVSVHSLEEAQTAERAGADYVLYGHVYETHCKPGIVPRGLAQLEPICRLSNIPVIALGGIQPHHIPELYRAGVSGIAVMSGIWETESPVAAAMEYRRMADLVVHSL